MRILPRAPSAVTRLAWHSPGIFPYKNAPALVVVRVSAPRPAGSTRGGRFSDEPFRLRDVQFDCPGILVEACALSEEIGNLPGIRRFGRSGALPAIIPVERQGALEDGDVTPPAGDDQKDRATIRVALPHDRREIAIRRRSAKDACNLDVGRQPVRAHGDVRRRRVRRPRAAPPPGHRGCARRASSRASPCSASPG